MITFLRRLLCRHSFVPITETESVFHKPMGDDFIDHVLKDIPMQRLYRYCVLCGLKREGVLVSE